LIELEIDYSSENYGEPKKSYEKENYRGFIREYAIYEFRISYNFIGSPEIFRIIPAHRTHTGGTIYVDFDNNNVSFSFTLDKQDPEQFFRIKEEARDTTFINLNNANKHVKEWNRLLTSEIKQHFNLKKKKYLKENNFFEAIKLKVNPNTNTIFTAPTIQKRHIPKPKKSKSQNYSSEPIVSHEMYDDILNIIYESGKSMEKKPSLYQDKDEEGLRDQFLFILETRYEGTTATGETFNRKGKTDILLKYEDGTNLFVAECKFWHGPKEFEKAINQLFDRYLTWRDSKTALIFFVNNKDMTKVNATIKKEIGNHQYFVDSNGVRGETSFSYKFHLPQDKDKIVFLEVMTFHYDNRANEKSFS